MDAIDEKKTYDFPDQVPVKTWDEMIQVSETGLTQHGAGISPTKPLQSSNFVSGVSGYRFDTNGDIEANDGNFRGDITGASGTFTGTITATTGAIGGFDIGADYMRDVANSMGIASTVSGGDDVRFWAGDTFANRATADFFVKESGAMTASNVTITGGTVGASVVVAIGALNVAARGWTQTSVFSVTDLNTVAWAAGTFTSADGTAYSIGGGNTGNMATRTYIYLDTAVSTTAYQVTTTAATAVGAGKVLIATAINGTVEATYQTFGGLGGLNIDGANIAASSITSNEILANTIVAGDIAANTITANELSTSITYAGSIIIDTAGLIRSGQTAYDTGAGWWIGNDGGTPKISFGSSSGSKVTWDGTSLTITGVSKVITNVTADQNLTAGQTIGISNNEVGKVALANRKVTTATLGYTVVGNPNYFNLCPIGGDKFIHLSTQASDDSLYATVGSIATGTKTLTLGTAVAATADIASHYCVCKLDTDKFIVFYMEDASTTLVKYRVGTVSGTIITFGSAATFFTGATAIEEMSADFISTDKGISIFKSTTETNGRAVAFTVSSTTATAGTPVAMGTNTDANNIGMVKKIGTDKFVIVTLSTVGYAQVGTLSGTTITLGTEVQFDASVSATQNLDVVSPATDVFVIHYEETTNAYINLVAATVSTTTPTFGTILTDVGSAAATGGMYAESATSIVYSDLDMIKKVTLSGNTLTNVGRVVDPATSIRRMVAMDNSYYIGLVGDANDLSCWVQGMSNMFAGIAQSSVSKGATVGMLTNGQDSNQSGLIPGGLYQINNLGGLTFIASDATIDSPTERFVTAVSATSVVL